MFSFHRHFIFFFFIRLKNKCFSISTTMQNSEERKKKLISIFSTCFKWISTFCQCHLISLDDFVRFFISASMHALQTFWDECFIFFRSLAIELDTWLCVRKWFWVNITEWERESNWWMTFVCQDLSIFIHICWMWVYSGRIPPFFCRSTFMTIFVYFSCLFMIDIFLAGNSIFFTG